MKEKVLKVKYFALLCHLLKQTHTHIITCNRKLALNHQPDWIMEDLAQSISLIQSVDWQRKG